MPSTSSEHQFTKKHVQLQEWTPDCTASAWAGRPDCLVLLVTRRRSGLWSATLLGMVSLALSWNFLCSSCCLERLLFAAKGMNGGGLRSQDRTRKMRDSW